MIYLLRHGQTVWNRAQRLQGRLDSPLTRLGFEQALAYGEALARTLATEHGRGAALHLHSSPLGRAHQTAAIVADTLGLSADRIRCDERLAEHDVGAFSGKRWDEIEAEYGATSDVLRDFEFVPPGGESRRSVLERAGAWLATPRAEGDHVVVTHGGFSRALRGVWQGLALEQVLALPSHDHGRFYRLDAGTAEEIRVPKLEVPVEELLG